MSLRNPERGLLSVKGLIFTLGLIASFIFVGAIYGILIRPGANKADLANSFGVNVGSSFSSFFVILKDYEQQICLSLFLWGVMIIIYKFVLLKNEAKTLGRFAPENEGIDADPEVELLGESPSISRQRTKLSFNSCNPLYKPAAITGGVRCVMVTALLRLFAKLASEGLLHA